MWFVGKGVLLRFRELGRLIDQSQLLGWYSQTQRTEDGLRSEVARFPALAPSSRIEWSWGSFRLAMAKKLPTWICSSDRGG